MPWPRCPPLFGRRGFSERRIRIGTMDCHVFRRLCDELIPALTGARMEKIHQPADDVITFSLYASGRKQVLFLKFGRKSPFLFLSQHRLPTGTEPPAAVMRLRKYLTGRKISSGLALWTQRRLLLRFRDPAGTDPRRLWLDIDLREGPRLLFLNEDPEWSDPLWPDSDTLAAATDPLADTWRQWPVLSPALRRTLPCLEGPEQAALLADLDYGGGDLFAYDLPEEPARTGRHTELSAWPLPRPLRADRTEQVFASALLATARVGEQLVLQALAQRTGQQQAKQHADTARRLARLIETLGREQRRLEAMAARKADALALQAELYRFAPEDKTARIRLDARPDAPLELDPRYTVRENMTRWFHQAARGERGLAMLAPRMTRLLAERQQALNLAEQAAEQHTLKPLDGPLTTGRKAGRKTPRKLAIPKNIQQFQSDDGFLLLRGRDAQGNAGLLRIAAQHDCWIHVNGAASAHVLIRRAHARQDIPERTRLQAGLLAALKSERKNDAYVEVAAALVRHVRPLGSPGTRRPGNVRIDEVAWTRSIPLDGSVPLPAELVPDGTQTPRSA